MVNSEEFSKRLEKIMDFHELTASAFADQIDVGRSSISHILSGRNKPSLDFVMKIIESFPEVELYWLLNGKGSFPKQKNKPALEIGKKKDRDLFDVDDNDAESKSIHHQKQSEVQHIVNKSGKQISRIVVFYTDGTFENFTEDDR
ncbi:MAG TPA: XRE family transcriptional regulator [Leeuwenhoekiella sp.]|nr:XRE family transcriptional regulator [Leeuwenhoekiella sp.]